MQAADGAVAGAATGWGAAIAPRRAVAQGVRPITVLRWSLALMVIGNLGRIPVIATETKEAPLLVNELALLATLLVGAVACLQARTLRLDRVAFAAIGFALVGAGSALAGAFEYRLNALELTLSLAYLARWVAYFGLYVVILNTARDDDAEPLWKTFESAILVFAIFGIFQSIFLPGFAQLVYTEDSRAMTWDRQGHRLVSTLLDPNMAGALILLVLIVQVARLTYGERLPVWKPIVLLAAIAMTVSRSTALALFVSGAIVFAVRGMNRRALRLAGIVTVVALPFLPLLVRFATSFNKFKVDESAMARTVSWLRALTVFADNPFFGVGFNTYGFVQRAYGWMEGGGESYTLDGGLLFVAVMTGLVGLAVYATMVAFMWSRSRRLWRDPRADGKARGTALGVAAGTAAILVHSTFVNSMLTPFHMQALWMLWGLVFLHARRTARAGHASGVAA